MAYASSMRRAGVRQFGTEDGTDRCLDFTATMRASTPEKQRAWRADPRPGVRVRPQGPMRTEGAPADVTYGALGKDETESTAAALKQVKGRLEEYKDQRGEANYRTTKREPLGRGYTHTEVPAHMQGRAFGVSTAAKNTTAKESIMPEQALDNPELEAHMYAKSHGTVPVGARQWAHRAPPGADTMRFGKAAQHAEKGQMAACLDPSRDATASRPSRVVSKRGEDAKHWRRDEVGKSKYRGSAPTASLPSVFGRPSDAQAVTAGDCLVGDYSVEEQLPDADLGRATHKGFRNEVRDPRMVFGKPTAGYRGGRDPTAYECLCPAPFEVRGVTDEDFLAVRGQSEIRDVFTNAGIVMPDDVFDACWYRAATSYDFNGDGQVSVEEFRRAFNEWDDAVEEGGLPEWWAEVQTALAEGAGSLLKHGAEHLQKGGQGTVKRLHDSVSGRFIAVKIITPDQRAAARNETRALKRLRNSHAHIVHTDGILRAADGAVMIFTECAEMDLHDALGLRLGRTLGERSCAREWMLQIAHAVSHSHSCGVAHRDIKPENVLLCQHPSATAPAGSAESRSALASALKASALVDSKETHDALRHGFLAKLCDFGSASTAQHLPVGAPAGWRQRGWAPCGSARYAAPEVSRLIALSHGGRQAEELWPRSSFNWEALEEAGYNALATDVWCFGMLLYATCCGGTPFSAANISSTRFRAFLRSQQAHAAQDELFNPSSPLWKAPLPRWTWPASMSPALRHLVQECLAVRPEERPCMARVLQHPWFSKPTWIPPGFERIRVPSLRQFASSGDSSASLSPRSVSPLPDGCFSPVDGARCPGSGSSGCPQGSNSPSTSHVRGLSDQPGHARASAVAGGPHTRRLSNASTASLPSLPGVSGVFAAAAAAAQNVSGDGQGAAGSGSLSSGGSAATPRSVDGEGGGQEASAPTTPRLPAEAAAGERLGVPGVSVPAPPPSHALHLGSPKEWDAMSLGQHEASSPPAEGGGEGGHPTEEDHIDADARLLQDIHSGRAYGFAHGGHAALPAASSEGHERGSLGMGFAAEDVLWRDAAKGGDDADEQGSLGFFSGFGFSS